MSHQAALNELAALLTSGTLVEGKHYEHRLIVELTNRLKWKLEATELLSQGVSHKEISKALGVTIASIKKLKRTLNNNGLAVAYY